MFLANYYELIVVYDGLQEIWKHCLRALLSSGCRFQFQKEKKIDGKEDPTQAKCEFSRHWKALIFWRSSQTAVQGDSIKIYVVTWTRILFQHYYKLTVTFGMLVNVSTPHFFACENTDNNTYLTALFWGLKIMCIKFLAQKLAS